MPNACLDKVVSCPNLPSLPSVAMEVLELTRDEGVPLRQIASVVQNDQAMAGRILKTVNSSFYCLSKPCPTISRALAYLGMNTVKSLVLGFSLIDCFDDGEEDTTRFDMLQYWRRSIYSAAAARTLAEATHAHDPEEAFIAALLQDVGTLAMHIGLGDEYDAAIAGLESDHEALAAAEAEHFEFDHQEAGAQLAEKWRLPAELIDAIRFSHAPEKAPKEHVTLVRLVCLAALTADVLTVPEPDQLLARFRHEVAAEWNLSEERGNELFEQIAERSKELSSLFRIRTGEPPNLAVILETASDQMIEHQFRVQQESEQLQRSNEALAKQTVTDGLTGAFNRKRFDETLQHEFDERAPEASLAVLFMDADRFKLVNDTHGHQVGDAVLIELAKRISDEVGERGTVCRYGGEEFGVILPEHDRKEAALLAEAVRKRIEATPFDTRNVEGPLDRIDVTVSIGVASLEPGTQALFPSPTPLVQAADKAVYAAKLSGRNCVRAFAPRRSKHASRDSLPAKTRQRDHRTLADRIVLQASKTDESTAPFRILLIEDDKLHARLLETTVQALPGVEIVIASTGEAGITILKNGLDGTPYPANLVITDLNLPGISGHDVIRTIRESGALRSLPIIVLSREDHPEEVSACLEAGANAFVSKASLSSDPEQSILRIVGFWGLTSCAAS